MNGIFQDVRYALRGFRKSPGFALVAVATLALGIGANTAIFSVAKGILLDPLPYPEAGHLYRLAESRKDGSEISVSYPNFLDWRDQNRAFEALAAYSGESATIGGENPERLNTHVVSGNFFSTLRVRPAVGRNLEPADDRPGSSPVAVLSYELWKRRFGGDASVVGRSVLIDGKPRTVVGVAAPRFRFYDYGIPDLWTPLGEWARNPDSDVLERKSHAGLYVIGRLRPGVSDREARLETARLSAALARQHPEENRGHGIKLESLRESVVGEIRPALLIVSGSVVLLLLIACSNISNLLLARSAGRRREIAIRAAIGADRLRLVRQLLTESIALAAAGAIAGLVLAEPLLRAIVASRPLEIARLDEVRLDFGVLSVLAAVTLATGVLFGLAPALRLARGHDAAARGRDSGGRDRGRFSSFLIAGEIALCLLLLSATGLLARSFWRLLSVDPGFAPHGVLTARLDAPQVPDSRGDRDARFFEAVLRESRRIPGVTEASAVNPLPLTSANRQDGILLEGQPMPALSDIPFTDVAIVEPGYFQAMRIPRLSGRGFLESDDETKPKVAVVSLAAAKKFWPGANPLGRRFVNELDTPGKPRTWITVVGVVGDIRLAIDGSPASEIYFPLAQRSMSRMTLVVRSNRRPELLAGELAAAVHRVDPRQPLYKIAPLGEIENRSLAGRRFLLVLLAGFTAVGLILSVGGVWGLVSRIVTSRTREIGIRIALGARGLDVVSEVLREIVPPVAAGIAAGLTGAWLARNILRSVLFGVAPGDPATFFAVSALLAGAALAAAYFPARRAASVDPMVALREE